MWIRKLIKVLLKLMIKNNPTKLPYGINLSYHSLFISVILALSLSFHPPPPFLSYSEYVFVLQV